MHSSSVIISTPEFSIQKPRWSITGHILPLLSIGLAVISILSMASCDKIRREVINNYPTLVTPANWYWYLEFPFVILSAVIPILQLHREHLKIRWNTAYNSIDLGKHVLIALWPVFFHARALVLLDTVLALVFGCNLAQIIIVELHCVHRKALLHHIGHALIGYFSTLVPSAICISVKTIRNEHTLRTRDETMSIIILVLCATILITDAIVARVIGPSVILLCYLLGIIGTFNTRILSKFPIFTSLPIPIALIDVLVLSLNVVILINATLKSSQQRSRKNPFKSEISSFSSPLSASFTYRL